MVNWDCGFLLLCFQITVVKHTHQRNGTFTVTVTLAVPINGVHIGELIFLPGIVFCDHDHLAAHAISSLLRSALSSSFRSMALRRIVSPFRKASSSRPYRIIYFLSV